MGPMSGAEREEKRRRRASLFPQQQVAVRKKDVRSASGKRPRPFRSFSRFAAEPAEADEAPLRSKRIYI